MMYVGLPSGRTEMGAQGITSLEEYARHFNCVEGNTTLYALPKAEIVERWREQTTDDFRFCFKFPATISHRAALLRCGDLTEEFFTRMSPLANRIGQYWLQLPATFGPRDLPALWQFLDALPANSPTGGSPTSGLLCERRSRKALNRGLLDRSVNRVILDSRPVHSAVPHNEAIVDAQRKTESAGPRHRDRTEPDGQVHRQRQYAAKSGDVRRLAAKLASWEHTTTPYLFCTPDIAQAPELVDALWQALQAAVPSVGSVPSIPQQSSLF